MQRRRCRDSSTTTGIYRNATAVDYECSFSSHCDSPVCTLPISLYFNVLLDLCKTVRLKFIYTKPQKFKNSDFVSFSSCQTGQCHVHILSDIFQRGMLGSAASFLPSILLHKQVEVFYTSRSHCLLTCFYLFIYFLIFLFLWICWLGKIFAKFVQSRC